MARRLLLISNSTNHGQGYLDHVLHEIDGFLGPVRRLVFVPFALKDREGYGAKVQRGGPGLGQPDRMTLLGRQLRINESRRVPTSRPRRDGRASG